MVIKSLQMLKTRVPRCRFCRLCRKVNLCPNPLAALSHVQQAPSILVHCFQIKLSHQSQGTVAKSDWSSILRLHKTRCLVELSRKIYFCNLNLRIRTVHGLFISKQFGEQAWRSDESTRLPPIWPGFDSRTRRHMWVDFVVGSRPWCLFLEAPGNRAR